MKKMPNSTYLWVQRVISSCVNNDQLVGASKLTNHYLNMYPNDVDKYLKLQKQIEKIRF